MKVIIISQIVWMELYNHPLLINPLINQEPLLPPYHTQLVNQNHLAQAEVHISGKSDVAFFLLFS
jgi:hypothetical protein